jgi:hypothetical protein
MPEEEMESALAVQASNASVDGTFIGEKTLQIAFCLGVDNSVGSEGWINRFKIIHNIVCNTAVSEGRSVYSETVADWKSDRLLHDIKECDLCDIFNVYETGLSFNIQLSKILTSCGGSSHGGTKSKLSCTAPCM